MALLDFLGQLEGKAILDQTDMAHLNVHLAKALAVCPALEQQVLDTEVKVFDYSHRLFNWSATAGFQEPLSNNEVAAFSQLLMLHVSDVRILVQRAKAETRIRIIKINK